MVKAQIIITLVCIGMSYAGNYGNSFNNANYYPYTGHYVGTNTGSQYSNGYNGYGSGYSSYGSGLKGYGPSVYNNVILPHPYPVPVPFHNTAAQTGSRFVVLRNGVSQNNGLLGFGDGGIFGFVIMLVVLQYILRVFNQNQNQG